MAKASFRGQGKGPLRLEVATRQGALFQGDCMDLLGVMGNSTIDCVFADPPFNLGKSYGSRRVRDKRPDPEYLEWTIGWLAECVRVLRPGGSLFVYHVPRWLIPIGSYLISCGRVEFRHWIVIKMKNHFPVEGRLHPTHYGLLYFTKIGGRRKFKVLRTPSPVCPHCGELLRDYGGYGKKYQTDAHDRPLIQIADVWDDIGPRTRGKARPRAVNELNPEIARRAISLSTKAGDVVLDPFVGGGGVVAVAEELGRLWIGAELGTLAHAKKLLVGTKSNEGRKRPPKRVRELLSST